MSNCAAKPTLLEYVRSNPLFRLITGISLDADHIAFIRNSVSDIPTYTCDNGVRDLFDRALHGLDIPEQVAHENGASESMSSVTRNNSSSFDNEVESNFNAAEPPSKIAKKS
jgi:hypothetical protein